MSKWLITFVLCMTAASAAAQVDRATVSGVVHDASGGVLPKAQVSLTNLATGVVTKVSTTAEGTFLAVDLAPGDYAVEATADGFQPFAQTVHLVVGQRGRLEFSLSVGEVKEAISVSAEATPLLNTESAVRGTVIDQNAIAKLPLAIRNWDDLLALVAGVQGDRYTEESGGGTSAGRTGNVNVHGIRSLQNNFLLDGVDNNSISENVQELSTQVSRPSIDAINEFKVVTSPFSAEYRPIAWRRGERHHQVGHERPAWHRLRVLPQSAIRLDHILCESRRSTEAGQRAEPVRREHRRSVAEGSHVLLLRL